MLMQSPQSSNGASSASGFSVGREAPAETSPGGSFPFWGLRSGQWQIVDDPLGLDETDSIEDAIERAGYAADRARLGVECDVAEIHVANELTAVTRDWPYLVNFSLSDEISFIFVGSLPDLLAIAPALMAFRVGFRIEDDLRTERRKGKR